MRRRKNKGSSMLLVISIFGILSIVGTSMLAAATANYKLRIQENNRVKNLYSAESGIDMAYIELVTIVDEAIIKGKNAALDALKANKSVEYQNDTYKMEFTKHIVNNLNYAQKEFIIPTGKAVVSCELKNENGTADNLNNISISPKVATLTSSYVDANNKERMVSVSYDIDSPGDYSSSNGSNGGTGAIVGNYAFATDGDMKFLNNVSAINVLGDLWVNGRRNSEMISDPVKFKYDGGIEIRQSKVTFNGNVITPSNIVIVGSDNSKFGEGDNPGTIYAENIYLGDPKNLEGGDKSTLRANDMYIANDLVIGSSAAVVKAKNLFGFNDANLVKDGQEVRGSSSIIVNSTGWINAYDNTNNIEKVKLNITDSVYLMGSAYIKAEDGIYQTGESVALKGNYSAYSYPFMGDVTNTEFIYFDPLLLIDKNGKGESLSIVDKAEHFKYVSEELDKLGSNNLYEIIKRSIISLPENTYTAGATISKDRVEGSSYTVDQHEEVARQKSEFVKMAYYMGDDEYDVNQFNEGKAANGYSVLEQINWEAIKSLPSYDNGLYYYKKTSDNTHIIASDKASRISIEQGKVMVSGYISWDKLPSIKNGDKVIIITKGKASSKDTNNLNLTILAGDDIELSRCSGNLGTIDTINEEIMSGSEAGQILAPILGGTVGGESNENTTDVAQKLISKGKWTLVK